MNFHLTEPNPGDRVSANLVREIVRAIRSLTPVSGHGVRITRGPHGTVYNAKVEPGAGSVGESSAPGRYEIESIATSASDDSKFNITFKNPYYRAGAGIRTGPTSVSNVTLPAIVALVVDVEGSNLLTAQLGTYETMSELNEDTQDVGYYILPLYEFDADGNVACDFRIGPEDAIVFEAGNSTEGSSS